MMAANLEGFYSGSGVETDQVWETHDDAFTLLHTK